MDLPLCPELWVDEAGSSLDALGSLPKATVSVVALLGVAAMQARAYVSGTCSGRMAVMQLCVRCGHSVIGVVKLVACSAELPQDAQCPSGQDLKMA